MTYIFIAHAPDDLAFVKRLSQDLWTANLEHWFEDGQADDAMVFEQLQKATHVVAILSPEAQLHEKFLAAIEFAKQNNLARLALRVKPLENLPPQLQGVLPLDFTKPEDYADKFETLLEDFTLPTVPPKAQLPQVLLDDLNSDDVEVRRQAIEKLLDYRKEDEVMKNLAHEELNALVFRERDSTLKTLVRTTLQLFDKEERQPEPVTHLPSKEELEKQAVGRAILVEQLPPVHIPVTGKRYLWQSNRWQPILGTLAILIGLLLAGITGEVVELLPVLALGVVLPYFNVWIRKGGAFEWKTPAPLIWNTVLGVVIAAVIAALLMLIVSDLDAMFIVINAVAGGLYGLAVGMLSIIES